MQPQATDSLKVNASVSLNRGNKPLTDMLFHVIGASLKKDVVKLIRQLGGKGTKISERQNCCMYYNQR